tara:strand:+ start:3754 stop:4248 length:495 start_codon:yes stop_codon:yes gene_type:complete
MLYTKHFAEQLAQHATSFWINKREETEGSAGYKIENYIEENDAFLQHYVDMEYEEEDERYCDNDDCPYGGYIFDTEIEKYKGKEYICIGCDTGKGLQEREQEEEEEEEICPSCGDEWTEATRCDCPERWLKEEEEETSIYNGIELPRFVDGREVISYPNAGLPK